MLSGPGNYFCILNLYILYNISCLYCITHPFKSDAVLSALINATPEVIDSITFISLARRKLFGSTVYLEDLLNGEHGADFQ